MEIKKFNEGVEHDDILNRFSNATNRSVNQTKFLLDLVDNNLMKLIELEEKMKNNFIGAVPGSKEEVQEILNMGYGKYWWKIKFIPTHENKPYLKNIR